MPKGVIDFSYDSGKQYTKKRKRLPGANPDKKPEIKQFNPYDGSGSYAGFNFYSLVRMNQSEGLGWLPWRLEPLSWPAIGTNSYERIGNSFFLKAIRFKGYVEISRNVLRPIRWRLKLFRFERPIPDFKMNGTYTTQTDVYLSLYRNVEHFVQGINANQTIDRSRHNFYKMIKDLPKDRPYTSKVLASGVIPANNNLITKASYEYGQTNSFHIGTEAQSYQADVGCFPIDVLVKCNDRITWSLDDDDTSYVADVRYCLVLEDDFGMGVYVQPAGYTPGDSPITTLPEVQYVANTNPCYYLRLSSRAYFTDD